MGKPSALCVSSESTPTSGAHISPPQRLALLERGMREGKEKRGEESIQVKKIRRVEERRRDQLNKLDDKGQKKQKIKLNKKTF